MKLLLLVTWCSAFMQAGMGQNATNRFFPYPYTVDTLTNGLRLVTVPTEHKNLVALYIVVRVGSRNEIEPGKSGFAHFFEHMMFRGSEHYSSEQRDAILKKAGAEANAYTSDDRTVYHELFAKEDLPEILKLEADRFQGLKYTESAYKTEALAVLGEYNKNSANPMNKLVEALRESAFIKHTYKHTTMGFLEDIQDMPNEYEYSHEFYKRYYRPEYTTITLVGDVQREGALELTKKFFGDWQPGNYKPEIPAEPPQKGAKTHLIDWPSPTLPYIVVAFHGPAYSDVKKDKAALDFVALLGFGENSELYQKLVLKEQKVDMLMPEFDNQADPELFGVIARVKNSKDMDYVRDQIVATFEKFTREKVTQQKVDETRSRLRYGTALGWVSADSIAEFLVPFIALKGTPETINKFFALYQNITPADIMENSKRYFVEDSRTIVTLAAKPANKEAHK
jgi:zinc protease